MEKFKIPININAFDMHNISHTACMKDIFCVPEHAEELDSIPIAAVDFDAWATFLIEKNRNYPHAMMVEAMSKTVGVIGVSRIFTKDSTFCIYMSILQSHRAMGIGVEVLRAFTKFLQDALRFEVIVIETNPTNVGMCKTALKAGYEFSGIIKKVEFNEKEQYCFKYYTSHYRNRAVARELLQRNN